MSQDFTGIPSKNTGDQLTANEFNLLNNTVNDNSNDMETRLTQIEGNDVDVENRTVVLENTDVTTIPTYTTATLPTSGSNLTNGKIAFNSDTGVPVYFRNGVWYTLSNNTANIDANDLDVFLVLGQSNAEGWSSWAGLNATDQAAPRENTLMYLGEVPSTTLITDTWEPINPGVNTSWQVSGGFGPEVGFSDEVKSLVDAGSSTTFTKRVAMAKVAKGGMPISTWDSSTGFMYAATLAAVTDFTTKLTSEGYTYNIRGAIWFQGESDTLNLSDANAYETNLTNFITNLRTDISIPNLPFVIAKVAYTPGNETAYLTEVRNAQQNVADNMSNVGIVDSALYGRQDSVHLSGEGQYQFGEDCAAVMEDAILGNV